MKTISDSILIDRLKIQENGSIEILYKLYFPAISAFIKQNSGNIEDSQDVFQETILILLQKVRQPGFELTSSLKTYLFSISRNLWLKRLRDNKSISMGDFERFQLQCEQEDLELKSGMTREEKVGHWITRITQHCQKILKAIFSTMSQWKNSCRQWAGRIDIQQQTSNTSAFSK